MFLTYFKIKAFKGLMQKGELKIKLWQNILPLKVTPI